VHQNIDAATQISTARIIEFREPIQADLGCQPILIKINVLPFFRISGLLLRIPARHEGRIANVGYVGRRCGGRDGVVRDRSQGGFAVSGQSASRRATSDPPSLRLRRAMR
jgi:hypothetical protein